MQPWPVSAFLITLGRNYTGLLWPAAFKAPITRNLPADGRFVSLKQLDDLSLIVSGFHKGVVLIPFNLVEMFLIHGQLRLAGQEALNVKHAQQPSLQLIKVALRAFVSAIYYIWTFFSMLFVRVSEISSS